MEMVLDPPPPPPPPHSDLEDLCSIQLKKLQKQSVRDRDLVFVERAEEVKEAKRAAKEAWRLAKRATKEAKRLAKRAAKLVAREADRLKARSSQSESTIA